jgi:hypothetical protein
VAARRRYPRFVQPSAAALVPVIGLAFALVPALARPGPAASPRRPPPDTPAPPPRIQTVPGPRPGTVFLHVEDEIRWTGVPVLPVEVGLGPLAAGEDWKGPRTVSVRGAMPGSPAAWAGFRPWDQISSCAGEPIARVVELQACVAAVPIGSVVDVAILRDGVRSVLRPVVEARPVGQVVPLPPAELWDGLYDGFEYED